MERIVLHMDIDYFFAQVEENENPPLKGKPVVVCVYSGRDETSGAVSTSNYEARKYGVKAGVPIKEAIRKLRGTNAAFLPVRHGLYSEISLKVMEILAKYGEKFEYASIDEGIIEITMASGGDYAKAERIALAAKSEILEKMRLTCSMGIGPNKLIAKIASDFKKPDGLTIVKPSEADSFLGNMEVRKVPGIGEKTEEALERLGIRTVADLRRADPAALAEYFGKKSGGWLYLAARGTDESPVGNEGDQKQLSRIATLKKDTRNLQDIMGAMEPLIRDIEAEIGERGLSFSGVGVNLVDASLKPYAKAKTLFRPTSEMKEVRGILSQLFAAIISETKAEFRRAGIRVEKLESRKGQKTLGEF